jgi:hypothetical protein
LEGGTKSPLPSFRTAAPRRPTGSGSVEAMRNIWKGLVAGAVVGAGVGLALDMLYGVGDQLASATREARRRAPEAAATGSRAVQTALNNVRNAAR